MSLREKYLCASKKDKSKILDEYTKNTGHNRKYVITVMNTPSIWNTDDRIKKQRKRKYGPEIEQPLSLLWEIFDYPCGQRLKPCINAELDRLIKFGEINVSDKIAALLKSISSSTIDRMLKHRKILKRRQGFSTTKPGSLLKAKIPVRLTDWDTSKIGFLETDLVAHCGSSAFGQYLNTVSLTDIATGWWEGEAVMGKGQNAVFEALKICALEPLFNGMAWTAITEENSLITCYGITVIKRGFFLQEAEKTKRTIMLMSSKKTGLMSTRF